MKVNFKLLNDKAKTPRYALDGDAGLDVFATSITKIKDKPSYLKYHTGIAIEIPVGYVGLLAPRSSIYKKDMIFSNSIGIIDSGYRGEITIIFKKLFYNAKNIYKVGDAIGQLIIIPYPKIILNNVSKLSATERGESGYGSTDKIKNGDKKYNENILFEGDNIYAKIKDFIKDNVTDFKDNCLQDMYNFDIIKNMFYDIIIRNTAPKIKWEILRKNHPTLGLFTWDRDSIMKEDLDISKNYFNLNEFKGLINIILMIEDKLKYEKDEKITWGQLIEKFKTMFEVIEIRISNGLYWI